MNKVLLSFSLSLLTVSASATVQPNFSAADKDKAIGTIKATMSPSLSTILAPVMYDVLIEKLQGKGRSAVDITTLMNECMFDINLVSSKTISEISRIFLNPRNDTTKAKYKDAAGNLYTPASIAKAVNIIVFYEELLRDVEKEYAKSHSADVTKMAEIRGTTGAKLGDLLATEPEKVFETIFKRDLGHAILGQEASGAEIVAGRTDLIAKTVGVLSAMAADCSIGSKIRIAPTKVSKGCQKLNKIIFALGSETFMKLLHVMAPSQACLFGVALSVV